jgi:hypothetical protein
LRLSAETITDGEVLKEESDRKKGRGKTTDMKEWLISPPDQKGKGGRKTPPIPMNQW